MAVAAGNNDVAKVAPVWKQLITSIFSWQTALVAAITLLSVYGKDIIEWTKNLLGADTAQKRLNESLKEFNNLVGKGQADAKLLFDTVKRTTEGTQGRAKAIQEINKVYAEYLPYLLSEQASLKELEVAYKIVNKALIENAALKAKTEAINDVLEKSIDKQANALNEMRSIASEKLGGDSFAIEIMNTVEGLTEDFRLAGQSWQKAWQGVSAKIQSEVGASKLPSDFYENLEDYVRSVYDSNQQISDIQKKFNPFFNKEQADQAVIENKKYYETMKSQAESFLNSIAADQKKLLDTGKFEGIDKEVVERYKEAKANIQEATKQLKIYDSYDKQNMTAQKEYERQAKEQKKIQERINNELLELKRRNEQSRIDLMEEGSDKRIAQIEYDYDREIEAIRKREKEWREAQGGKLTQEQTVEIKTAITQAQATRMRSTQEVENEQIEAQRKAMNDYLKEYGTYQDKKMALAAEYGQKIALAETEGEKLILGKEWDKQLSDLEIKSGNTANAIIALFGDMKDKTLKELIEISTKGKEALEFLKSGEWDESKGKGLGITQEQFNLWSDMPEIMDRVGKSVESTNEKVDELRPAFDKVTEGVRRFFAAGDDPKKLTESLQLINEGVNEVMTSVQFLSNTFGKLGDSFGGAFNDIAEGLNMAMDAVNSAMQGAQAGAMFGPIGASAGAAIGVVTSLASSIAKIHDKKNEKRIQRLQDQIDVLDASYEKLGRSIEKAYSTDASKLIDQQNKLLEQQKVIIQQQIEEERNKKKTDDDRIKDWQKQLEDINAQLEDNKEKAVEAITGTDVMSAIDEFAQAYSEAWATGTDAAETSTKIVQNLIKTAIIEFLKKKLSPSVEEFMKKLADYMSDGIVSPWEEAELNKLKEKMDAEAQKVFDTSSKYFQEDKNDKYEQTATSGGFEKMSQDSADELNGRFTALQMTGEEILLFLQGSEQFLSLLYIKASMDVISVKIASLYDVADETRTMIASIYIELQQINDNTANTVIQLKKAVDKLTSIETNTKNM